MGRKKSDGTTFEDWCKALDAYHEALRQKGEIVGYGAGSATAITGTECWQGFFDDDFTPEDALDEDRTEWDA